MLTLSRALRCSPLIVLLMCGSAAAAPNATLTATTTSFGDRQVGSGPSAAKLYTLRNTGTESLTVGTATVDGAAFALGTDGCVGKVIAINATCTITATFAPATTGALVGTVRTTAGTLTPSAAATGTGRDLRATPTLLDLGRTRAGTPTAEGTLTLKNFDTASYTLGTVTVSNSAFTVTANTCSNKALAAGDECTLRLTGSGSEPAIVTTAVAVAGFLPSPAGVRVETTQPSGSFAPVTASWGRDTTATRTFTVRNTASEPLVIQPPAFEGPDAGAFSTAEDGCSAAPVAVNGSCSVRVSFAPTEPGYRTASLKLATNAAGPPLRARLDGFGAGADPGTDPLSTPFTLAEQPLARLQGDGGDFHGQGLTSGPCDVNDDGYDDVLSGAPTWSRFPVSLSREGAAYVTFGAPDFGSRDLAAAGPATRTLRIEGAQSSSSAGLGISCAGDVNGDGIDDILIGSWSYEYPGRTGTVASRGIAHVVFGSKRLGQTSPIDTGLLGSQGFAITAPDATDFDHLAVAVAGVGDVNADGLDDVALLANTATVTGTANRGVTYIVAGRRSTADVNVGSDQLMHINGGPPGPTGTTSSSGQALDVAGVGDVNGDGTPDIGVGQYTAVFNGRSTASGAAWVVSGAKRGTVELGDPAQSLMTLGGSHAGHRFGSAIDAAGDVDGDGIGDVVVGADSTAAANSDAAYVIYGKRGAGGEVIDTATLGTRGYRVLGDPGDSTGFGLAPLGDVDGDGHADLAVGRYASGSAGAVSLVFGVADPTTLPANAAGSGLVPANAGDTTRYLRLSTMTPAQGSTIVGTTAGERLGRQVADAGDVDGNGVDDLAIGADQALRFGRSSAGEVSVALLRGPRPVAPPLPPVTGTTDPGATPTGPGTTTTPPPATTTGPTTSDQGTPTTSPPPPPAAAEPGTPPTLTPVSPGVKSPRLFAPQPGLRTTELRASATGRVAVGLACPADGPVCTGTVALRIAALSSRSVSFRAAPGATSTARIVLSSVQRRALRRARAAVGRLSIRTTSPGLLTVQRALVVAVRRG